MISHWYMVAPLQNFINGKPLVLFLPIAIGIRNSYLIIGTTLLNLPLSCRFLTFLIFFKGIRPNGIRCFATFVLAHSLLRNILRCYAA